MSTRIATDNCAGRLELFQRLLSALCRECEVTLNLGDIHGCIAVRDSRAVADPEWPAVATFEGVGRCGVAGWEISAKPETTAGTTTTRQRKSQRLSLADKHACRVPGCDEQPTYSCDQCDRWFCDDHGQRGGDRQVQDVGAVAYPALCDECRRI